MVATPFCGPFSVDAPLEISAENAGILFPQAERSPREPEEAAAPRRGRVYRALSVETSVAGIAESVKNC